MPFRVITKQDAGELVSEFRGITGARRAAVVAVLDKAGELLADESQWAGRTQKLMRDRVQALVDVAKATSAWDGPTRVEVEGLDITIEQDGDAPTANERKASKAAAKAARWLAARYPNKCGTCGAQISKGDEAFYVYDERKLYCRPNGCGLAREVAQATDKLLTK